MSKKIIEVYLEKRKARIFVGLLSYEQGKFIFVYDDSYRNRKDALRFGPDISLRYKRHESEKLFPSFEDRIPSKENPAYSEYCQWSGIDEDEDDPMVLLAALGRKGPSSFILAAAFERNFSGKDVKRFRQQLNLSIREFADIFDFAPTTINRLENNKTSGKDALKRIELYFRFPEAALFEIERRGIKINDEKKDQVIKYLKAK